MIKMKGKLTTLCWLLDSLRCRKLLIDLNVFRCLSDSTKWMTLELQQIAVNQSYHISIKELMY